MHDEPSAAAAAQTEEAAEAPVQTEAAAPAQGAPPASPSKKRAPWEQSDDDAWAEVDGSSTSIPAADSAGPKLSFDMVGRAVNSVGWMKLADSPLNPPQGFLRSIPQKFLQLEARPDLTMVFGDLSIRARPRARFDVTYVDRGEDKVDATAFLLEWFVRYAATPDLVLSVGKEFLQWGPALLYSPSNPFFVNNYRLNPIQEGIGSYFVRSVWAIRRSWSLSILANLWRGEGPDAPAQFERRYAVKADYTGDEFQLSLIASDGESTGTGAGAYAVWTASQGLLLYAEGGFSMQNHSFYPVRTNNDFGVEFLQTQQRNPQGSLVIGGSYTIGVHFTLNAEYIVQSAGYTRAETALMNHGIGVADRLLATGSPEQSAAGSQFLLTAFQPGPRFLNQHYVLGGARVVWSGGDADAGVVVMMNVIDQSASAVMTLSLPLGSHMNVLGFGSVNLGKRGTEFRRAFDFQALLALEIVL